MFIHDVIKIKYINEGYLPNYPYHLITDQEMFEAFTSLGGYFETNYPNVADGLQEQYDTLKNFIFDCIENYITKGTSIPDWIYSYMLGEVLSINSEEASLNSLYVLLYNKQPYESDIVFDSSMSTSCYIVSSEWIRRLPTNTRPATMFGEPHIVKSLRLASVNVLG